jgi:hypothetical protein
MSVATPPQTSFSTPVSQSKLSAASNDLETAYRDLEALISSKSQAETSEQTLRIYKELLRAFFARHDPPRAQDVNRIVANVSWEATNRWCLHTYGDTPAAPTVDIRPVSFNSLKEVFTDHSIPAGEMVTDQQSIPGPPVAVPWMAAQSNDRTLIDAWILAKKLNKYGDPPSSSYNFLISDRYDYIRKRHPSRPWIPNREVVVTGTGTNADNCFGILVWKRDRAPEQLFVSCTYEVVLDESGKAMEFNGANLDYWNLREETGTSGWLFACGGISQCCCCFGLLALILFLLNYQFHTHAQTCLNSYMDGTETGIDCGGPDCERGCGLGIDCNVDSDCASPFICSDVSTAQRIGKACSLKKVTVLPGCVIDSKLTLGTLETGPDCGGACAAPHLGDAKRRCGTGIGCEVNDDCDSGLCMNNGKCS